MEIHPKKYRKKSKKREEPLVQRRMPDKYKINAIIIKLIILQLQCNNLISWKSSIGTKHSFHSSIDFMFHILLTLLAFLVS